MLRDSTRPASFADRGFHTPSAACRQNAAKQIVKLPALSRRSGIRIERNKADAVRLSVAHYGESLSVFLTCFHTP